MEQQDMGSKENVRIKLVGGAGQMSLIRDTEEVIKFLEFAGRKSILNEHAVNCRLTACHNLFSVIQEEEDSVEHMLSNLDVLTHRFRNKNVNVQASTIKVYKSRVKSSLEDYKAWSSDPFAWERSLTDKAKLSQSAPREKKAAPKAETKKAQKKVAKGEAVVAETAPTTPTEEIRNVNFPLRKGMSIDMTLPAEGLTVKELKKLCLFLYPYCTDMDLESVPWVPFQTPAN